MPEPPASSTAASSWYTLVGSSSYAPANHEEAAIEEAEGYGIEWVVIEIDDVAIDDEGDDYDAPLAIPPLHSYVGDPSNTMHVDKLYCVVCLRDIPHG